MAGEAKDSYVRPLKLGRLQGGAAARHVVEPAAAEPRSAVRRDAQGVLGDQLPLQPDDLLFRSDIPHVIDAEIIGIGSAFVGAPPVGVLWSARGRDENLEPDQAEPAHYAMHEGYYIVRQGKADNPEAADFARSMVMDTFADNGIRPVRFADFDRGVSALG